MDKKSVELRYELFVKNYMSNGFNAAEAAIAAGYSEKDANKQGFILLAREGVREIMQRIQDKTTKKLDVSHKSIAEELKHIAFSSVADAFNDWTDLKRFDELTEEQKKCISKIDVKTVTDKEGNTIEYIRMDFHDKIAALKELGKHTGFYEIDNSQKNQQSVNITVSDPSLANKLDEE